MFFATYTILFLSDRVYISALIIRIYIQCTRELTVFPIANINTTNIHFSIDQLCLMREMDNRNCND
jgi:hypothetical protein